ncbi:hypothetical protein J5X84_41375 [Streptosporangiaceae bacterium NEAU-GS5]|nr:hypothetical protein [Streptosporangiaceae bacterium NEAU-GS5]
MKSAKALRDANTTQLARSNSLEQLLTTLREQGTAEYAVTKSTQNTSQKMKDLAPRPHPARRRRGKSRTGAIGAGEGAGRSTFTGR